MKPNEVNHCVRIPNGIMTVAGDPVSLTAFGVTYRFEWHNYCGPMFVSNRREPLKNPPGERNRWWDAFSLWMRQGKRTENGECIYTPGTPCGDCNGKGYHPIDHRNATPCHSCGNEGVIHSVPTEPFRRHVHGKPILFAQVPS